VQAHFSLHGSLLTKKEAEPLSSWLCL